MTINQNLIHIALGLSLIFSFQKTKAQLSGILTVPGTYTSLAAAINDLNTQGVNGPTTVNIAANYTETAVYGGYSVNVTGTSVNPITFQKNGIGANPLIYAYSGGTATPNSSRQDGIFLIRGSDYITFDGIDILDTNSFNPATMEFGYCFFKLSQTNGCQFNMIKNCVISLNRNNNGIGTLPAGVGSRGIEMVYTYAHAHTSTVPPTSVAGTNSYNKFYNNIIQNCNMGIVLHGYAAPSPFTLADFGNDIGGNIATNGNQVINYGGAPSASFQASGIQTLNQYNINISNNLVNNNNGAGINHASTLKGIFLNVAPSANSAIDNNTVTVNGGGSTVVVTGIENYSGSTPISSNTINITNNLVTNCTYSTATSGPFYAIYNGGHCDVLNINNNVVTNNSSSSTTGSFYSIHNIGTVNSIINLTNNFISNITITSLATGLNVYGIANTGAAAASCTLSIASNTFQTFTFPTSNSNNQLFFITNPTNPALTKINYNVLGSSTLSVDGYVYFICNQCQSPIIDIGNNTVSGTVINNKPCFTYGYMGNGTSSGTRTIHDNNFSNFNSTSNSAFFWGIAAQFGGSTGIFTIRTNTVSNISGLGLNFYGILSGAGGTGSSVRDNLIYNMSCSNQVDAMSIGSNSSTGIDVYNNTIHSLVGGTGVYALSIGTGSLINCYRNKIYNLQTNSTTGAVHGMDIWGGATNTLNIYNNLIGDLRQPSSNCNVCLAGIWFNTNTANTIINLSHNTVYLNATATATSNFGSVGLYQTYNGSAGSQLILKNNLIINNCTPVGTGSIVAFRRGNPAFGSYTTTSNNNVFYAGTPGPNRYIYFDGTNLIQTLPAFQTFATPRENLSATELTPFTTTVGASSNYLDLNTSTPTFAESGGLPVSGITDDFGANLRNVSTPDIGAWEGNYTYSCNPPSPAVNITPASSTTLCSGGTTTISASATGTISWYSSPTSTLVLGSGSTFITPTLSVGTYTYFAENFTCAPSLTRTPIIVYVSFTPTVNAGSSQSITSCSSPTVSLSGSGIMVITYTWSGPGIVSGGNTTNPVVNAAGIYSLTGSNSGCVSNTSTVAVVMNTIAPTVSGANTGPICIGQSATLTAGGSANSFTWSTGAFTQTTVVTPTTSSTYSVIGMNSVSGCTALATTFLMVNPKPTITLFTPTVAVCEGAIGCISASGGATYVWSGPCGFTSAVQNPCFPFSAACQCAYNVTVTSSSGCTNVATACLTVVPNPTVSITSSNTLICTGQTSTLTSNGALTYSWSTSTTGSTTAVSPTVNTTYTVTGTDSNGCIDTDTITQYVSACTGISYLSKEQQDIRVFPNPFNDKITIVMYIPIDFSFQLYNTLGSVIYSGRMEKGKAEIDLSNHSDGIYFIKAGSFTKKIIKN